MQHFIQQYLKYGAYLYIMLGRFRKPVWLFVCPDCASHASPPLVCSFVWKGCASRASPTCVCSFVQENCASCASHHKSKTLIFHWFQPKQDIKSVTCSGGIKEFCQLITDLYRGRTFFDNYVIYNKEIKRTKMIIMIKIIEWI